MACICRFQISVKPASCSCSPVPYYILIFLIFQGRVVEDPSITSYTRQNQKQKGAFTLICASSWPRYYLMTLLSSALSKKRQRRPVYAYRRSCLWPYCSTEHTCAFRFDPHEPAGTHPPRPPCAPTHACRTHVQKRPRSLCRNSPRCTPRTGTVYKSSDGIQYNDFACKLWTTAISTNVIGPVLERRDWSMCSV